MMACAACKQKRRTAVRLSLAARTLRIEAPIPGKSVVGIEVPNLAVGLVSLRDVVETAIFRASPSKLTVALGRDVAAIALREFAPR